MSVLKGTWVVVEDGYECLLEIQQERRIRQETVDSQICTMRVFDWTVGKWREPVEIKRPKEHPVWNQ